MLMPMSLGVLVLVLVMAGNFVYWAINSVVNQGMSAAPVIKLFFLAAPGFAVQGIPAGVILGVCLVINRAVRDNEILALRAGGASLPRIIAPFMVVALLASICDYLIVEKLAPITNDLSDKAFKRLVGQSVQPFIDNDRYFHAGQYYFYVGSVENGVMRNVMIYQRDTSRYSSLEPSRFPVVMIADTARENPRQKGQWILEKGWIHYYDNNGRQRFETPLVVARINVAQEVSTLFGEQKNPFSMTGNELVQKIEALKKTGSDVGQVSLAEVEYWRRFALPGACFVMALCAAPLALRYARHGSFAGLVAAFGLAFLWQGFDGWFRALGIAGYLSPFTAAAATNVIFLVAGAILLVRER